MKTLEEYVRYYYVERHYNCSEALIQAANDYYGLHITEDDMRMFGGFGGGMYSGIVCGTVVSIVATLSKMIVKESARKEGATVRPVIASTIRDFKEYLGGLSCPELKPKYYNKEDSCLKTVLLAAEVLERSVEKLKAEGAE